MAPELITHLNSSLGILFVSIFLLSIYPSTLLDLLVFALVKLTPINSQSTVTLCTENIGLYIISET